MSNEVSIKTTTIRSKIRIIITMIAISMSLFHLYTGFMGSLTAMKQRPVHLGFALILTYLVRPAFTSKRISDNVALIIDVLLALLAVVVNAYIYFFYDMIAATRMGTPNQLDFIMGAVAVVLVLESTRRTSAKAISYVAMAFIIYGYFGKYIPGFMGHRGYNVFRLVHQMYFTTDGIYSLILGVSANFIFLFILFATVLRKTNIADYLTDLSNATFGTFRGGPAKVAVLASALFGSISGSAAANVAATGSVTIPMMKKLGYKPEFAAAVEACASAGGQFMPPIMGAAAFIIAEVLGMPYGQIALAAAVPALLYFMAIFIVVDFEAVKNGLRGIPREKLPKLKNLIMERWYLLLPLVILVYLLVFKFWSPQKAAFYSIVAALILSSFNKVHRINLKGFFETLEEGAISASIEVTNLTAAAGIIIAIITLTGVGLKLSDFLVMLSGESLILLLILTAFASIIMGMGLPPVGCYVILSILVAPALVKLGVVPLSAHLFVFYFGIIAVITPPVAAAAYIGAGIAGADPVKTGYAAFRFGLAAFLLPFAFVYSPSLLLIGSTTQILLSILTALVGIISLSAAIQNYLLIKMNIFERSLVMASALMLIFPNYILDILGVSILVAVYCRQYLLNKKNISLNNQTAQS